MCLIFFVGFSRIAENFGVCQAASYPISANTLLQPLWMSCGNAAWASYIFITFMLSNCLLLGEEKASDAEKNI